MALFALSMEIVSADVWKQWMECRSSPLRIARCRQVTSVNSCRISAEAPTLMRRAGPEHGNVSDIAPASLFTSDALDMLMRRAGTWCRDGWRSLLSVSRPPDIPALERTGLSIALYGSESG